jgi:hypothetical protein
VSDDILLDLDQVRDAAIAAQTGGPPLDPTYVLAVVLLASSTIRDSITTDWTPAISDVLEAFKGRLIDEFADSRPIDDELKAEVIRALELAAPGKATIVPADWDNGEFKVQVKFSNKVTTGSVRVGMV